MNKLERSRRLLQIAYNYKRQKTELNYRPIRLWVELSSFCNLRCIMCPQSDSASIERGSMSFELFRKIIDEAKKFVYDINLHHRGESLLHPELPAMIDYARKAGLYTRLHTNGTLLDEKKAAAIIESGLDFLSFSFDGFTAETYERIRRQANFDKTIGNISGFLHLKEKLGSKNPYTVFEVMELAEAETEGYKQAGENLRKRLCSLHLNKFVIKSPHNWAGSYVKEGQYSGKSRKFSACTFPWFAMVILWDGKVSPCPQDFFGHLIMGDSGKDSIASIWNNSVYRDIRAAMRNKQVSGLNPCRKCDMLHRNTFLNIPTPNLKIFSKEMFLGHR